MKQKKFHEASAQTEDNESSKKQISKIENDLKVIETLYSGAPPPVKYIKQQQLQNDNTISIL